MHNNPIANIPATIKFFMYIYTQTGVITCDLVLIAAR